MPQRQAVGLELSLKVGPQGAGLDPRRPRGAVDLQHLVEVPEVDADDRAGLAGRRLDPADDARPAAVWDGDQPLVAGPVQKGGDVFLSAWQRDPVRGRREIAPIGADHVPIGLAVGVARPLVEVVGQDLAQ